MLLTDNAPGLSPVNLYVGQVVYEMKCHNKWLMRFLVAQNLDALLQVYICAMNERFKLFS